MKKKLLTLTFTLILLIGLVAAMGMNASAATPQAFNTLAYVSNYDQLDGAIDQAGPGWTIVINNDIKVDNDANQKLPALSVQGTLVIDLNGHDIEINSRFTNEIFQVGGKWSTDLHIVNSKFTTDPASIILNSTQAGASVISINDANSSLHLYEGVNIVTSTDGDYFAASSPSNGPAYGISALNFNTIGIHGADITIRSAYGSGIKIYSGTADTFANSKLIIDGGANIKAKVASINLQGSISIPKMEIKSCYLDYETSAPTDPPSYSVKSDYKAIDTSSATLKFSDITPENTVVLRGVVGYNVAKDTVISSIDASNSLRFGYNTSCTHPADKKIGVIYFLTSDREEYTHYAVCGNCTYNAEVAVCNYVYKADATSEAHGHTAGYDCSCGYKTTQTLHYYTEYAKAEPTCTTFGNKETMYVCRICTTYYDSNKNQVHGKVFLQNKISALGHDMKAVAAVAATCTKDGNIAHYDCSRCDHITSDAEGKNAITNIVAPKTGHKEVKLPAVAATYKADGKTEGKKCTACGEITVEQQTVAKKVLSKVTGLKTKTVKLASGTKTTLTLAWTKVADAEKYEVYQQNGKKWNKIGTTSKTTLTVKKLKANKSYKFKVRAIRSDAQGAYSSVFTGKTVPLTTSSLKLKAGSKSLTASWNTVANITGYEVQYSTAKNFKKNTKTVTVKAKSKKTTIKKLSKGKKYYVKVRTYKTVGSKKIYSAWSSVKSVKIK